MKKKIISITLVITGFIIGASTLSAIAAWTAPTCNPSVDPGACNTPAPLNVGSITQDRLGALWLKSGLAVDGNIVIATGTPAFGGTSALGKVLTAVDASGTIGWRTVSGLLWKESRYIPSSLLGNPYIYTFTHNLGTSDYKVNVWLDYTTPSNGTPTKNGALIVPPAGFTDGSNNTDHTISSGITVITMNNSVEIRTPSYQGFRSSNCIAGSWSNTLVTITTNSGLTNTNHNLSNYYDCKKSGWLIVELSN